MKILAVSDEVVDLLYSPQIRDRFGEVDLVLGCGDLPYYYLEFIVTMLAAPLYYVPGNHDKPHQYVSDGRILSSAEGCVDVDGQTAEVALKVGVAPLLLGGLGGCLRYNNEGVHQYTQSEMTRRTLGLWPGLLYNRLRHGRCLDIFIAHAPPLGIHDAPDLTHTGFEAFLRLMRVCRPRFLLHGHAHIYRSDTVTRTMYHHTEVLNVYPYRIIEW